MWVSRGKEALFGSVYCLFVLYLAIMRVDVNWTQKLYNVEGGVFWREAGFLWIAYAQNLFAVQPCES